MREDEVGDQLKKIRELSDRNCLCEISSESLRAMLLDAREKKGRRGRGDWWEDYGGGGDEDDEDFL